MREDCYIISQISSSHSIDLLISASPGSLLSQIPSSSVHHRAANACWIVLCKCMLDIKCSVLRGWSCAITKSVEFWLRTDENMGLTLSIEDIFLLCSELKRNVVEPSSVSDGTATMIRRCCWCVQDVRLQDCYAQVTPGLAKCCESACWRVLCKCMLDIRCSVLRVWSCAITRSFEFWLRTVEKMGLILSPSVVLALE